MVDHVTEVRVDGISLPAGPLVPVRLATTCRQNSVAAIDHAVREMLQTFLDRNSCERGEVLAVIFTATSDLHATKPAAAARRAGWEHAQFLCLAEMPTDDDVPLCLRALLFVSRSPGALPLTPVYLHGARALRPDLASE